MFWTLELPSTRAGYGDPSSTAAAGLADLAELAAVAIGAPIALIFIASDGSNRLVASSVPGFVVNERVTAVCKTVLETGRAFATAAVALDEQVASDERFHFCVAVPILSEQDVASGVICVLDKRPRPALEEHAQRVLQLCASQARAQLSLVAKRREGEEDQEYRLKAVFDAMEEGVVLQDHSGAVVTYNAAAQRILSGSRSKLDEQNAHGPPIAPLIRRDGSSMPDDERPAAQVLRTGGIVTDCVMGLQFPGAGTKWVSANAAPIRNLRDERPVGTVVTFRDITEHVRITEAVAESEASFRALFDSLPVGICVSHGRTMRYVNRALVTILGYDREDELIGSETLKVVHRNSIATIMDRYARIATGDYPPPGMIECVRRDGQSVIVEVASMAAVFEGKPATIAIIHDVTERDRASKALARSEARLRALIAFAPVGIFETDIVGGCIYANDLWSQITGLIGEDSLGWNWLDAVHPEDRDAVALLWKDENPAQVRPPQRLRFLSPEGKTTFVWLHAAPLLDDSGGPNGYLGAVVDFTEQHAIEQALLNSEANFRTLSQRAPVGIGVRIGSEITYANAALLRMHGLESEAQLIGVNALELAASESRDAVALRLQQLARGEPTPPLTVPITRADGTAAILEVDSLNIEFGGRSATMSLIRDVTELQRAHAERDQAHNALLDSLAQKVTLLKEVHHRVKNNLQVIASLLRLGREYVSDLKSLDVFNDSIARVHSIALIHEHLYQSDNLDRIDLRAYLRGLVAELRRANASPLFVEARVAADAVSLDLDRCVPIGLIVNELVTNAFKHAFVGGESKQASVVVSFVELASEFELSVQDNGVGLQGEPKLDGSLGLLLVANLVRQLSGTLSRPLAAGTLWSVKFPKTRASESEAPGSS